MEKKEWLIKRFARYIDYIQEHYGQNYCLIDTETIIKKTAWQIDLLNQYIS